MARPIKNNAKYFPHDANYRNDIRIRAVRNKFGPDGYSIVMMTTEHLCSSDNFEMQWCDGGIDKELLAADFGVDSAFLVEVINYCIFLKIFELRQGMLHSPALTDDLSLLIKRRKYDRKFKEKKDEGIFHTENVDKMQEKGVFHMENCDKMQETGVFHGGKTTNKIKENKTKEKETNKEIENREKEAHLQSANPPAKVERQVFKKPLPEEVAAYVRENRLKVDAGAFYDHYESNGWMIGRGNKMKDWKAALRNWSRREKNFAGGTISENSLKGNSEELMRKKRNDELMDRLDKQKREAVPWRESGIGSRSVGDIVSTMLQKK